MPKRKDKVDLTNNIELERKDREDPSNKGYDFIYRSHHITSIDEQKIKTKEIEEITNIKK